MDNSIISKKRLILVFAVVIALLFVMDIIPKKPINISGAASGSIIMCINRQPEINASCSASATTTISYNCTVNGSARDLDQSIVYLDNATVFNISQSGGINFTPSEDIVGNYSILLSVEDNSTCANNRSSKSFSLSISSICANNRPSLNITCNTSVMVGANYSCLLNASAEDAGQSLEFMDNATLFNVNATGGFNFTPSESNLGYYSVNFTVFDNSGCSNNFTTRIFNFTVQRVCGSSTCDANESCSNCSIDCGECAVAAAEEPAASAAEGQRRTPSPSAAPSSAPSPAPSPPPAPAPAEEAEKPSVEEKPAMVEEKSIAKRVSEAVGSSINAIAKESWSVMKAFGNRVNEAASLISAGIIQKSAIILKEKLHIILIALALVIAAVIIYYNKCYRKRRSRKKQKRQKKLLKNHNS